MLRETHYVGGDEDWTDFGTALDVHFSARAATPGIAVCTFIVQETELLPAYNVGGMTFALRSRRKQVPVGGCAQDRFQVTASFDVTTIGGETVTAPTIKVRFNSGRFLVICYGGLSEDGESRIVWPGFLELFNSADKAVAICRAGFGPDNWGVWDIQEGRVVATVASDSHFGTERADDMRRTVLEGT